MWEPYSLWKTWHMDVMSRSGYNFGEGKECMLTVDYSSRQVNFIASRRRIVTVINILRASTASSSFAVPVTSSLLEKSIRTSIAVNVSPHTIGLVFANLVFVISSGSATWV